MEIPSSLGLVEIIIFFLLILHALGVLCFIFLFDIENVRLVFEILDDVNIYDVVGVEHLVNLVQGLSSRLWQDEYSKDDSKKGHDAKEVKCSRQGHRLLDEVLKFKVTQLLNMTVQYSKRALAINIFKT